MESGVGKMGGLIDWATWVAQNFFLIFLSNKN
jgi:hypothetical protein